MEYFIANLEASLKVDLPLLSLAGAFILIDAVSACDTDEGIASQQNFTKWLKKYLSNYLAMGISEVDYYKFRCALLHQLSGSREDTLIPTLLFFPQGSCIKGHMNRINNAFNLDIPTFVRDVVEAARKCILESAYYQTHRNKMITLHREGLAPYTAGIPVIGSAVPSKGKK